MGRKMIKRRRERGREQGKEGRREGGQEANAVLKIRDSNLKKKNITKGREKPPPGREHQQKKGKKKIAATRKAALGLGIKKRDGEGGSEREG